MHTSSILALALGATAVSAAAFPNMEARQACDPFCQFPKSLDCPANGGVHVTREEITQAVAKDDRSREPTEQSAPNLATAYCFDPKFHNFPLWDATLPNKAGSVSYAMAPNGTFYYCGTISGQLPSGWLSSCKEN